MSSIYELLQFQFIAEKQESRREYPTQNVFDSSGSFKAMLNKDKSGEINKAFGAEKIVSLERISTKEPEDYKMQPTNEYTLDTLDMSADRYEKISTAVT